MPWASRSSSLRKVSAGEGALEEGDDADVEAGHRLERFAVGQHAEREHVGQLGDAGQFEREVGADEGEGPVGSAADELAHEQGVDASAEPADAAAGPSTERSSSAR